jgi:hypothetical protein
MPKRNLLVLARQAKPRERKLDPHRAVIASLRKRGLNAGEVTAWLLSHAHLKVSRQLVWRYLKEKKL